MQLNQVNRCRANTAVLPPDQEINGTIVSASHLAPMCFCGGPGGRPGMTPICVACFKFHRANNAARTRQAHGRGDANRAKLLGVA